MLFTQTRIQTILTSDPIIECKINYFTCICFYLSVVILTDINVEFEFVQTKGGNILFSHLTTQVPNTQGIRKQASQMSGRISAASLLEGLLRKIVDDITYVLHTV